MKKLILISALLLFAFDAYGYYSCARASEGKLMSQITATKIQQELRCLNKATLEKDFNKIFEIAVRPEQQMVTIIRDRNKNTKEYKEKVFLEDKIKNKDNIDRYLNVKSRFTLPPKLTLVSGFFDSLAEIACQNAFGDVDGWKPIENISAYIPQYQEIKSQQMDNPGITKRSGLLAKNNYTEYHYKIYDFEATYVCKTRKEFQERMIRAKKKRETLEQEIIAREKEAEEEKRLAELEKKKSLCREIGAEDESSAMVLCVTRLMEIDKMSEIAEGQKQQAINDRNRALNEMARVNEQIRKDEQSRRQSEALINLGAAISSGGGYSAPSIRSSSPATSQSRYSKTLTVPSNQNCPIMIDALVKQEVIGLNRICYYR